VRGPAAAGPGLGRALAGCCRLGRAGASLRALSPAKTQALKPQTPPPPRAARLCTAQALDDAQPPVGIPAFVRLCPDAFGRSLFFVRIEEDATSALTHLLRPLGPGPGAALAAAAQGVAAAGDSASWLPEAGLGGRYGRPGGRRASGDALTSGSTLHSGSALEGPALSGSPATPPLLTSDDGSLASAGHGARPGTPPSPLTASAPLTASPKGARGCAPAGGACPIEGLLLGPLLGRGSYGRVYRGIFRGQPVAVKVTPGRADLGSPTGRRRGEAAPRRAGPAPCPPPPPHPLAPTPRSSTASSSSRATPRATPSRSPSRAAWATPTSCAPSCTRSARARRRRAAPARAAAAGGRCAGWCLNTRTAARWWCALEGEEGDGPRGWAAGRRRCR
jgi:hypothetical protein